MKKKSKPYSAPQAGTHFPLRNVCGTWVSLCGSPGVKIFHDGSRFRLQLSYKDNTKFTVLLCRSRGIAFFHFYGIIRITYDDEYDLLILTNEGEYKRVYE
jgi:hypothetical protein